MDPLVERAVQHGGVLSGMQILLVEDNEINQQVACEILQSWGASVDLAANGQLALDLMLTKEPAYYAVVLMDLEMPVMNGHEATLRLRADSRFRDLPIIAMTAHAARLERERANAEDGGYIIKPFEPDELLAMLRPYLRQSLPPPLSPDKPERSFAEAQYFEALSALPEVDGAVLLRRFNGRVPSLARSMSRFVDEGRGFVSKLSLALGQGIWRRRGVRRIPSKAWPAFAMTQLQRAAIELEQAIKSGMVEPVRELAALEMCCLSRCSTSFPPCAWRRERRWAASRFRPAHPLRCWPNCGAISAKEMARQRCCGIAIGLHWPAYIPRCSWHVLSGQLANGTLKRRLSLWLKRRKPRMHHDSG
ncbi:MAG: response regulator [Betaproteobacteria bacterium]|nr:response regulator [Candidatus Dechloromonas phosphorivorans]